MNNGLYNGLNNGTHNGNYEGLDNGLHNGLHGEDIVLPKEFLTIPMYQKKAIINLITDLKTSGIWDKLDAIYPFVGMSIDTMKLNLKKPENTDAAFRLLFSGRWVFSITGAKPNGVNAYADTCFNPAINAAINSLSYGIYSRTEDATGTQVYGVGTGTTAFVQNNLTSANFINGGTTAATVSYTASPTKKLIMSRRDANNFTQAYRNGVSLGTYTGTISSLINSRFFFGARNYNSSPDNFSKHELAFAFIGKAMTDSDAKIFTTIVNNYCISLNRNV